ncbi:MAG TPA: hypothetical protein VGJ21_17615 [Terracidiphilus sp.]
MGGVTLVVNAAGRWKALVQSAPPGLRRLAGHFSTTLVGQVMLVLGLFVVTRVSAGLFTSSGFGQYQVARRTLAVIALPLMCGVGISMPRYIARSLDDRRAVARWLFSSVAVVVLLSAGVIAYGLWDSSRVCTWVFGSQSERWLVPALLAAVVGTLCHTLAYSALRGFSRFHSTATLQVVDGALVPLAGVLLASGRVERALIIASVLWVAIGGAVLVRLCWQWSRPLMPTLGEIWPCIRAQLVFGVPRIPGEVALFGLFALPVYATVHRNNILGAGLVSVGLSLVQSIAMVFSATGFVLLPYWSRTAGNRASLERAQKRIGVLLIGSAVVASLGVGLIEVSLHSIAHLVLGRLAAAGVYDLRGIVFCAIPYAVYLVLRDYFDAVFVAPINTLALVAAILLQAALLSSSSLSVIAATVTSFTALGLFMAVLWVASLRQLTAGEGEK